MAVIANLEARYSANIIQFDRELKRMQSLNARAADRILADHKGTVRQVNGAWAKADIGGALNKSLGNGLGALRTQLMGSIAAITSGAGIAAAVGLADTYNRFTNSLKVAGVEGANLKVVQDALFESANRNGVAVESLGQLYGRVSQASRELGASQAQILQVTDAVAAAIRVSGQPMSAASGAMMQMSQALGGGTVRAEEFNSMMEGMLPLLQAAAGASTKYGGSVAKMRADVIAGKLSSKELFDLIIAGSAQLEAQAARAPLTVAQSFEALKNKMIEAMGATNETWGITDRLSEALGYLANHLDDVAKVLGIVALAIAATLAPAIGRATIALGTYTAAQVAAGIASIRLAGFSVAMSASMTGVATSSAAAAAGLRLLMSATGVGLAIVALTATIGFFAAKSYKTSEAIRQVRDRLREKRAALDEARAASDRARVETGNLTQAELEALTHTANLTGEVDLLSTAYGRLALEAKRARLEILMTQLTQARADEKTMKDAYDRRLSTERGRAANNLSAGARSGIGPDGNLLGDEAGAAERRAARSQEGRDFVEANRARQRAQADYASATGESALTFVVPPIASSTPAATGGSRGGSSEPSAADRTRNGEDAEADAVRRLRDAVRGQAETAESRHAASLAALADDRDAAQAAIRQRALDKEIEPAMADRLIAIEADIYAANVATETARRTEELRKAELAMETIRQDNVVEALRLDADELSAKAASTADMTERHEYERQALAKTQEADDLMFAAEQEALRLQLVENGYNQAQIEARLAERQGNRDRQRDGQTAELGQAQDRENGPETLDQWAESFRNATNAGETFNQKMFGIAEGGINALTDGITDAITGSKSLADAFKDVMASMIASLIKLMVQWAIWEAIGLATGNGPGWGLKVLGMTGGGGKGGSGSGSKIPGLAMGTRNFAGGPAWVSDTELINLPGGSQVIPANVVRQAMGVTGRSASSQNFNLTTVVNANNAVMREDIRKDIFEAHQMAVARAKAETMQNLSTRERNRLR